MKAFTVCVQYQDFLKLTLPCNSHHFDEMVIITSPADTRTQELVVDSAQQGYPTTLHVTDEFYARGADFNKGAALEEALTKSGRDGWLCLLDADIVLPANAVFSGFKIGHFYCPHRHWCEDPTAWRDRWDWSPFGVVDEKDFGGYCHIFHGSDAHLGGPPWYPTDWRHAGGADTFFHQRWPAENKHRPDWTVLHLGPAYKNWHGRITPMLDGEMPEGFEDRLGKNEQRLAARRGGLGFSRERL